MTPIVKGDGARWATAASPLGGLPLGILMEGRRRNLVPEQILSDAECTTTFFGGQLVWPRSHPQLPEHAVWAFEVRRGCWRRRKTDHVDKAKVCIITKAFYSKILELDPEKSVEALRWMFS